MELLQPERACDWWSWFRLLAGGPGSLHVFALRIKLHQDPQVRAIVAFSSPEAVSSIPGLPKGAKQSIKVARLLDAA